MPRPFGLHRYIFLPLQYHADVKVAEAVERDVGQAHSFAELFETSGDSGGFHQTAVRPGKHQSGAAVARTGPDLRFTMLTQ